MFDYTTHVAMHREGAQVAGVVTRLSTTLTCGVLLSHYTLLREAAPGQARPTATLSVPSAVTARVRQCALCCCVRCRGAAANTRCHPPVCLSYVHLGMLSGPGSTQTHGLPGDTFTSPEHSTDSVDSQSHTKLSSKEVEEESKHQGSKVSNARSFTHKSLVPTHQDVTCASFFPTMQDPSEPAEGESDPHEEPQPATVKGECRVAVCLSMLVPTTNMRRGDADMLHHSLPTLTTANVSLVCLYLCIKHIL